MSPSVALRMFKCNCDSTVVLLRKCLELSRLLCPLIYANSSPREASYQNRAGCFCDSYRIFAKTHDQNEEPGLMAEAEAMKAIRIDEKHDKDMH